jgi:hypothetical protein
MAKMRYCIAHPAPKKASNIQMRWSVQDPLSSPNAVVNHKLSACLHWLHICWCIHSVVPHLGIVKVPQYSIRTNLVLFEVVFSCDAQNCLNMFASTAHHAIHRWKMFPSYKSIAGVRFEYVIDRHQVAPFFTRDTGDRTGMSTWEKSLRTIELLPIGP